MCGPAVGDSVPGLGEGLDGTAHVVQALEEQDEVVAVVAVAAGLGVDNLEPHALVDAGVGRVPSGLADGVLVGVVVDTRDPTQQRRIRVRLPSIDHQTSESPCQPIR